MSFIRAGWDMRFVEGVSEDYIFPRDDEKGNTVIEDYGSITKEGLVECVAKQLKNPRDDQLWIEYLMMRLAEQLKVKLRNEPLSTDEIMQRMSKRVEKHDSQL